MATEGSKLPLSSSFFMLVAATLSGFATYFTQSIAPYVQLIYLAHTLFGLSFSLLILNYIRGHFGRSVSTGKVALIVSGLVALLVMALLVLTGLHISFFGQSEALRWIYDLHIYTAYATVLLLGWHLLYFEYARRRTPHKFGPRPAVSREVLLYTARGVTISTVTILALGFAYGLLLTGMPENEALITPYEKPYGDSPFAPSQATSQGNHFVIPAFSGRSDKCGTCHETITRQWRSSMHAQAASDKAYQTNVNLLSKTKGMASTRYCEGCHAPVALLGGQLTKGGRLDTTWHMDEGVSCMGCHGITHTNNLKGNAAYHFEGSDNYLFNNSDNPLLSKVHNYLINIQPDDHRRRMARPLSTASELCSTCHSQFMDKDINQWGWVKMQDEYNTWLNSPYSGQSKHTFSQKDSQRCQDCHFPLISAEDPSADHNGMVSSHSTPGANTAIPWFTGDKEQLALVSEFLQNDKIRVTIREPSRSSAMRSQKPIDPNITPSTNQPGYFYLNEKATISVVVTNANVGHNFPGGTTDINEAWIHFHVIDAQGNKVYESGALNESNDVDRKAYFYRTIAIDRHGNEVWKHDLFNMTGDSYNKVIPAGQSDISTYTFSIPSWAKSPLSISAVVRYRKFNNRYARWALQDETIELPIIDMARHSISIPLRTKPEAESLPVPRDS